MSCLMSLPFPPPFPLLPLEFWLVFAADEEDGVDVTGGMLGEIEGLVEVVNLLFDTGAEAIHC